MAAKNCELYANKTALAPMVRAGRTPLRMLALGYGADLVYTEEIVDQKLLASKRIVNDVLGTIDYVLEEEVVLRIAKDEAPKCILQIGTSSAGRAVEVCRKYSADVAAIDVNMGCPKPFSISGGMGAALLKTPEIAKEILDSLTTVSPVPISCKIRVQDTLPATLEFAQMVERCGVSAIGVHGRRRDERPKHANRVDEIREVVRCASVPVLANGASGSIECHADIARFREETGASSVMVARKAFSNPSIFQPKGVLTMQQEIENFLDKACEYDENYTNVKYVVQRILGSEQEFDPRGRATVVSGTVLEICRAWSKEKTYYEWRDYRHRRTNKRKPDDMDIVNGVRVADISFAVKKLKNQPVSPKCVLITYCDERRIPRPTFEDIKTPGEGRYESIVTVDEKRFTSKVSQANKKMAQQASASA
ncbi:dihydrouridine synthase domain-containing protein [Aphelenchoides avenae]|nr:dihydrouridine synthase domain-containing protein [Aphelenchus avenae]